MDNFDKKEWLNYISKLNERQLNRRQSSGLTFWALFGVLAIIILDVIDSLPKILISYKITFATILLFSFFVNLIWSLANLIGCLVYFFSNIKSRSILTNLTKKGSTYSLVSICLFLIVILISNFYVIYNHSNFSVSIIPYIAFFVFITISLCTLIKDFKKRIKMNSVAYGTSIQKFKLRYKLIGLTIFFIIYLYLAIKMFINIDNLDLILSNIFILKINLEIVAFFIVLILLTKLYSSNIKYDWLESFERSILLNDLDCNSIKECFINEFLGVDTKDWLKTVDENSKILKNKLEESMDILKNKFTEVSIDSSQGLNDSVEILTLNLSYINNALDASHNYTNFIDEKTSEVEYLIANGPLKDELLILKNITHDWKNNYKYSKVCKSVIDSYINKNLTFIDNLKENIDNLNNKTNKN